MKILFVINQLHCGGAEQQLVTLCEGLRNQGHKLEVISLYDRLDLRPRLDTVKVPITVAHKYAKIDLSVVWRLRELILKCRPHLIHSYLPAACLFAGMTKWVGVTAPIIYSERSINAWRPAWRICLDNAVRRTAGAITCNAEAIKRHLIFNEGVPAEKIIVIYNGLSKDRRIRPHSGEIELAQKRLQAPRGAFIVICVANFVIEKQHRVLLHAFARARERFGNLFLVLVGRGELQQELFNWIEEFGLVESSRVITDCNNPLPLLYASEVGILTSSVEGCSNALLESMAARLPIVATDAGGNRELIINGKGGFICPVGDVGAVSDALVHLADDPSLRQRMGSYNTDRVADLFTDEVMIDQTVALYRRVLGSTGSQRQTGLCIVAR
jgi:glycosyltransferase involved in cell wall biosynthesis